MEKGDKVHYTGDRANEPGWGTVTKIDSRFFDLEFDDPERKPFRGLFILSIEPGPGRLFWPEGDWRVYRQEKIEELKNRTFMKHVTA